MNLLFILGIFAYAAFGIFYGTYLPYFEKLAVAAVFIFGGLLVGFNTEVIGFFGMQMMMLIFGEVWQKYD